MTDLALWVADQEDLVLREKGAAEKITHPDQKLAHAVGCSNNCRIRVTILGN